MVQHILASSLSRQRHERNQHPSAHLPLLLWGGHGTRDDEPFAENFEAFNWNGVRTHTHTYT